MRRCERAVRGAALGRLGCVVDGGAHERVAELDVAVGDGDEPRCLGLLERRDVDAERLGGAASTPSSACAAAAARSSERRAISGRRATRPAKARSTVVAIGSGPSTRLRRDAFGLAGELDQRERIAARRPEQPLRAALGHWIRALAREQRRGTPRDRVRRARAAGKPASANGEDSPARKPATMATGSASSRRAANSDGLDRRLVEPLRVVHETHSGSLLGRRGQHAERRCADHQPLAADARPERERSAQRGGLGRGQVLDVLEHGTQQLQQAAERDRCLAARRHAP